LNKLKILAIETAAMMGGVALADEEGLIAEYRLGIDTRNSDGLLPAIDRMLSDVQIGLSDLGAIAVSIGPGSYTGLRVGLAMAKGLAIGTNLPLIAVPTLEAMAAAFPYTDKWVSPWLYAGEKNVHWGLFRMKEATLTSVIADSTSSVEEALQILSSHHESLLFVGGGALRYQTLIMEMGHASGAEGWVVTPRGVQFPSPASVAACGMIRLMKGDVLKPEEVVPVYSWKRYPMELT